MIYGDVCRGFLGSKLFVFLSHPDDIEVILNSNTHLDKSAEYNFFKPWLGDGLLISSGDKWRTHRKLIAPAFHQNVLKSFVDTFNENSLKAVARLSEELGKEIDVHDHMSETTVDILLGKFKDLSKILKIFPCLPPKLNIGIVFLVNCFPVPQWSSFKLGLSSTKLLGDSPS